MNAVVAATGIKKQARLAETEGREAMLTSASSAAAASKKLKPATRTTKPRPSPSPLLLGGGESIRAHRPARRPVFVRAAAASSSSFEAAAGTAAAAAAAAADSPPSLAAPPPPLLPEEIAARLDHAPALSALDLFVALLASALAFALASALTHLRREGSARIAAGTAAALSALSPTQPLLPLLTALAAFALALSAARERAFAALAFSARELADPDSRFARLLGVEVHYKVAKPSAKPSATKPATAAETGPPIRFSIAAMHGFGAAAFSWSLVARPLADLLGACFTKHDMPGFGLTERPSNLGLSPYSLAFNGRLARAVADLEVGREVEAAAAAAAAAAAGPAAAAAAAPPQPPLRVLMGHSLGAVCAAAEAARDPEGVDALVLVAPAIVASGKRRRGRETKGRKNGGGGSGAGAAAAATASSEAKKPPTFSTLPMRLLSAASVFASSLAALLGGWAARALIVLTWPFLVFLLRAAVRSFQFWENGLSAALGGSGGGGGGGDGAPAPSPAEEEEAQAAATTTTPAGIPLWLSQRYRLPSLVRGWETGFLLFLLARVPVASVGVFPALARAAGDAKRVLLHGKKGGGGEKTPSSSSSSSSSPLTSGPPAARLAAAVRGARVPLLVIHGDMDALVPLGNSARLVEQLNDDEGGGDGGGDGDGGEFGEKGQGKQGASVSAAAAPPAPPLCELVVLRNRGHTPQEEAPTEFVEAVVAFLERVEREKKAKTTR